MSAKRNHQNQNVGYLYEMAGVANNHRIGAAKRSVAAHRK
jgi:hypothetical protein